VCCATLETGPWRTRRGDTGPVRTIAGRSLDEGGTTDLEERGEPGAITGTALTLFTGGDPLERATQWAGLAPDVRRRRAVKAAHEQDAAILWELALVALTLRGKAGATASPYTVRNYKQGVDALLGAWTQENLLRPGRDAGLVWIRGMEARGVAPSTIRTPSPMRGRSATRPRRGISARPTARRSWPRC